MTIYDKNIFIKAENLNKIEKLYGHLKISELTDVVNRHLTVALDEVEQGVLRQKNEMAIAKLNMEHPDRKATDFEEW